MIYFLFKHTSGFTSVYLKACYIPTWKSGVEGIIFAICFRTIGVYCPVWNCVSGTGMIYSVQLASVCICGRCTGK